MRLVVPRRCAAASILLALAIGCRVDRTPDTASGVSWALAQRRADLLSDLRYELRLSIPDSVSERIEGRLSVRFRLSDTGDPLVVDFAEPRESVLAVRVGPNLTDFEIVNDHIVIPAAAFQIGDNSVEIDFLAGDASLNRNREFLYSLFVPDRARFAMPCFDQPDLKARFRLTLDVPPAWQAVANASLASHRIEDGRAVFSFAETEPISTYLFSFVAGEFDAISAERGGRVMHMYHRETDSLKVARNIEAIFDLHGAALDWLESYTGIDYPFEKFDFVLIPSFQYGGMEHPGAILYRASRLLLDESATQNDMLGRASLIAHETAHMWFGDLVTMEWFDDVWMKEVFANFMAAEIVNPSFPELDHELRFLIAHYPAAYEVDRTPGANPIRQELSNLREAGTLYGAIIYEKAPIVMKQLEGLVGEEVLRDGLREYLATWAFANASWSDLIRVLDSSTELDLAAWSRTWVEEPGRPTVVASPTLDEAGALASIRLDQSDAWGRGRLWNQRLSVMLAYGDSVRLLPVHLEGPSARLRNAAGTPPDFILANGRGLGYGHFELDSASLDYLLQNAPSLPNALTRGIVWLSLWEAMLEGQVAPARIVDLAVTALQSEPDELLTARILAYLQVAYWRFLTDGERRGRTEQIEEVLLSLAREASASSLKAAYFNAYRSVALSGSAVARLREIWREEAEIPGLILSESDYTQIALELAVRGVEDWEQVLEEQEGRIDNPDRRERFAFVRPALSADPDIRDRFFEGLKDVENREHEPWVLEALRYLHHPLRASASEKYILPSLELLEEIQETGDIFFPKRWLDATLAGHSSQSAAAVVRRFLEEHPDYPPRLKAKILQSADALFRAAKLLGTVS
ncbi:MAG: ERAP1-like C-terminal domain-containing protein [Gemmatimonadota bacterium]|nr:MAG: ERAP1-like C-terminal domain-containing protein [Gemmatimonadota bacterium]